METRLEYRSSDFLICQYRRSNVPASSQLYITTSTKDNGSKLSSFRSIRPMPSPDHIFLSSKPTSTLVGEARTSISRVQGVLIKDAIPADKLLLALLEHAIGDQGRRHTAAVILAAGNDKNLILEAAQTWLDHLLFPCKFDLSKNLAHLHRLFKYCSQSRSYWKGWAVQWPNTNRRWCEHYQQFQTAAGCCGGDC